jgi:hypothetical protein
MTSTAREKASLASESVAYICVSDDRAAASVDRTCTAAANRSFRGAVSLGSLENEVLLD